MEYVWCELVIGVLLAGRGRGGAYVIWGFISQKFVILSNNSNCSTYHRLVYSLHYEDVVDKLETVWREKQLRWLKCFGMKNVEKWKEIMIFTV